MSKILGQAKFISHHNKSIEKFVVFEVSEAKIGMFVKKFTQNPLKKKKNKTYTVLTTNKERTNKEQITFFKKIYWALIRNKFLERIFYQANCRFSYFDRLFLEKSSFY